MKLRTENSATSASDLTPRPHVLNLGDRERDVLAADPGRALADVDDPVFVAVDQRLEQHRANQAEDRDVDTDAKGERDDDSEGQGLRLPQRPDGNLQFTAQHACFCHGRATVRGHLHSPLGYGLDLRKSATMRQWQKRQYSREFRHDGSSGDGAILSRSSSLMVLS